MTKYELQAVRQGETCQSRRYVKAISQVSVCYLCILILGQGGVNLYMTPIPHHNTVSVQIKHLR